MSRDDFLIIGFTGAFASGCSEGSKLFKDKIGEEIRKLVDSKDSVNSLITNCYNNIDQARSGGRDKTKNFEEN